MYGEFPRRIDQVVRQGIVPASIALSPRDPYPRGLGNELVIFIARRSNTAIEEVTSYPRTYLDLGIVLGELRFAEIQEHCSGNAGWLYSPIDQTDHFLNVQLLPLLGPFSRLMYEGSVIRRELKGRRFNGNGIQFELSELWGDCDEPWLASRAILGRIAVT